jgi:hypothetical protein
MTLPTPLQKMKMKTVTIAGVARLIPLHHLLRLKLWLREKPRPPAGLRSTIGWAFASMQRWGSVLKIDRTRLLGTRDVFLLRVVSRWAA